MKARNLLPLLMLIITCFALTAITGCAKTVNKCEGVSCLNGGTCVTGTCNCPVYYSGTHCETLTCPAGYEGSNCQTEIRAKYFGNFTGTEACTSGNSSISVSVVTVSGDITKISISNLYGAGFITPGTLQTDGSIVIAAQTFGPGTISGTGQVVGGKVKFTYVVANGGASDNCTWTQN